MYFGNNSGNKWKLKYQEFKYQGLSLALDIFNFKINLQDKLLNKSSKNPLLFKLFLCQLLYQVEILLESPKQEVERL